jgi:pyruvate formate lyase activating enzyme
MSIATSGCNFHCLFCQNWQISQSKPEEVAHAELSPQNVIDETLASDCRIISYTYTEPTIFYEYMHDIAKLARAQKIKNVTVTNGFINPEPLNELCKVLDGSNIDFKGSDKYYAKLCSAWRKPVEEAVKIMCEKGVWVELTSLIIPGYNDKEKDVKEIALWTKKNLGADVPLHFSAFYPSYKMLTTPSTNPEIIMKARQIALKAGLNYVYAGNIPNEEGLTTYCPGCKKPVITRSGFYLKENKLIGGKCPYCNEEIQGVWD